MATTATRTQRNRLRADDQRDAEDEQVVSETTCGAPETLDLLDDDYTQSILVALCDRPQRGRDLADGCEASRPTVYRRLNRLEDAGLVSTKLRVDPDGHHCKVFHLVRDRLTVSIADGTITVAVGSTPTDTTQPA